MSGLSRIAPAALAAALAALALAGCQKARTEAVLVITPSGVRIPEDIDNVRLTVSDTTAPGQPLFDQTFRLCSDSVTDACASWPLSFTLIPGDQPSHATRLRASARRGDNDQIVDGAVFTFTPGVSLRLDFVLYANCLGKIDCADIDEACGPEAQCEPVTPVPLNGEPDLAFAPQDLASGPDLAPPDLTGVACGSVAGASCCSGASPCATGLGCSLARTCECGNEAGEPCCAGTCNGALTCSGGVCANSVDTSTLLTWDSQTIDNNPNPPPILTGVWGDANQQFAVSTFGLIFGHATAAASWTVMPGGNLTTPWHRISGSSTSNVWAVGDSGAVAQWNGTTWTVIASATTGIPTTFSLYGVWVTPSDVWIVGGDPPSASNPAGMQTWITAHRNGSGAWSVVSSTAPSLDLTRSGVWSDGSNRAVVAATDVRSFLATDASGISTTPFASATGTGRVLEKVWGLAIDNAWFVGNGGVVLRYDGSKMTQDKGPVANETLVGLSGSVAGSSIDLWAVGGNLTGPVGAGVIYHQASPQIWDPQTNFPTGQPPGYVNNDVIAVGPRDIYVVGGSTGPAIGYAYHGHQ